MEPTIRMDIGPVPGDEACEQLGKNYNADKARQECNAYIGQLIRQFGKPPEGARLRISMNHHDFGVYHSVEVVSDRGNELALEWALKVEGQSPANWDLQSKVQLGLVITVGAVKEALSGHPDNAVVNFTAQGIDIINI